MNDFAAARTHSGADPTLALDDYDFAPSASERLCNGETDDTGADD
jgi:hypothetical protein